MSSHHKRKFFINKYRQRERGELTREAIRYARLEAFEERRRAIRAEVRAWMLAQGFWMIAWLVSMAAVSLVGIWYSLR